MTSRRAAGAVVVVLAYVSLAALSGRLSPIARRPVLDGLGPVAPYQWVVPPPELAEGNVPPQPGDFVLRLTRRGSEPGVFLTPDTQLTLSVAEGTFAPHGEDRSVRLRATPLDPAALGRLPGDLTALGNALDVRATYEPSGEPADRFEIPMEAVLIYPVTVDLHARTHSIHHSIDGTTWDAIRSLDSPGLQQVSGSVPRPGYLVVAGVLTPFPTPSGGEGTDPLVIALLVGSAGALLVGAALLLRSRRSR